MTRPISPLNTTSHVNAAARIAARIDRGCGKAANRPLVFFRADDIAIPSVNFAGLIKLFKDHALPLCLATVPSWLTAKSLDGLRQETGTAGSQWCWHQHGHVHRNYEKIGKKQEFGPARTPEALRKSLQQGRSRLELLLGQDFTPVFTPPWNRCCMAALQALGDLEFKAVSRSRGASPESPAHLPDFQVNVDLHTRKELSPDLSFNNLLNELEEGLVSGRCGIMIHHQRMNGKALDLLDLILGQIKSSKAVIPVHFSDLLKEIP